MSGSRDETVSLEQKRQELERYFKDPTKRITLWDSLRNIKISGFAAPVAANVKNYLLDKPNLDYYITFEKNFFSQMPAFPPTTDTIHRRNVYSKTLSQFIKRLSDEQVNDFYKEMPKKSSAETKSSKNNNEYKEPNAQGLRNNKKRKAPNGVDLRKKSKEVIDLTNEPANASLSLPQSSSSSVQQSSSSNAPQSSPPNTSQSSSSSMPQSSSNSSPNLAQQLALLQLWDLRLQNLLAINLALQVRESIAMQLLPNQAISFQPNLQLNLSTNPNALFTVGVTRPIEPTPRRLNGPITLDLNNGQTKVSPSR